jgi:hypothetical protein
VNVSVITDGLAPLLAADATGIDAPVYSAPLFKTVESVNSDCPEEVPTVPRAKYVRVFAVGAELTMKVPSARLKPAIALLSAEMFTTPPVTIPCAVEVDTVIKLLVVLAV